jgi:hypothetical protein
MNPRVFQTDALDELEARQDDVLRQLDDLERRIAAVVAEYSGNAPAVESCPATSPRAMAQAA